MALFYSQPRAAAHDPVVVPQGILNPALYAMLARNVARPGETVRVINRGRALEGYYAEDGVRGGVRLKIVSRGETYLLSCPWCGDARRRMAVNHLCGVPDPCVRIPRPDGDGVYANWRNWDLWKCYNEECQKKKENRNALRQALSGEPLQFVTRAAAPHVVAAGAALEPVEFPGLVVPVSELAPDHPAAVYLRDDREFDLDELARVWDVGYAVSVPARTRGAMSQDRVIVPVRRDGVCVGWQARYAGEIDWKAAGVPKYLTYFPKSMTLYGVDEARDAPTVVLVEGVTDVWRYGPGAVSGLGKTLSPEQAMLLAARLRGRPLALVPDANDAQSAPAFFDSAARVVAAGHAGPVVVVPLPAGRDPAGMPRDWLRGVVADVVARYSNPG